MQYAVVDESRSIPGPHLIFIIQYSYSVFVICYVDIMYQVMAHGELRVHIIGAH